MEQSQRGKNAIGEQVGRADEPGTTTDTAMPARFIARRQAAVACADIVGYTILTENDDQATQLRWMRLLHSTVRPLAHRHGSTIVKSSGDGVVADFPTAADAFAWATALQQEVQLADAPDLPPLAFRVAIDQGEMHATDDDVYGACVNIAARLQDHAPPGGIVLTEAARNALTDPPVMLDLGLLRLRNIAGQVRAFAQAPATVPRVPIRAAPRGIPSIAIMPFENLGAEETHRAFADCIIEDMVLGLGALSELSVIARAATLGWTGGKHDPRIVGRMLGVRYVLGGTLRRGPESLLMTATLRETEEGDTIWAERFDVKLAELFAVQDAIVARAVMGMAPSIQAAELRRTLRQRPNGLNAYDLTLRGLHALDGLRRETFGDARQSLDRAIEEDPAFAMPVALAARWNSLAVGQAWSDTPEADAARMGEMAARAVQLDPRNALGHAMLGHHRAYHQRDPESALSYFDRALAACPNHAMSWTLKSASLSYLGRGAEALAAAERGFALQPSGPERYYSQFFVGIAHHACGDHEKAVRWTGLSLADNPGFTSAHRIQVAALVALGRTEEAKGVAADMLRCEPRFSLARYRNHRSPFVDPALRAQLLGALETAGVPE